MGHPQKAADAVIRKAFELGSEDNLTVVVIMFDWQLERLDQLLDKWEGAVLYKLSFCSPVGHVQVIDTMTNILLSF